MIKTFEMYGTKYNNEKDNTKFIFSIDEPVKNLKDSLNGCKTPGLTDEVYFIQYRTNNKGKFNSYLLYDFDDITLTWVREDVMRSATEQEVEDAKLRWEVKKYNI